jgi:hypothetical protein
MHDDGYGTNFYDTDDVWEDIDDKVRATYLCIFSLSDTSKLEDAREHI